MKVAIVGGMPTKYLPANRSDWEVWGINGLYPKGSEELIWSRRFNLHCWAHLERDWAEGLNKEHRVAWERHAEGERVPYYVFSDWPPDWLPDQQIFPLTPNRNRADRASYHATSIDWLVCYAMALEATEIELYGIGLNMESHEPISARACLEYWCGWAEAKGVHIVTQPDADLFKQFHLVKSHSVYGYDDVHLVEDLTQ